MTATISLPEPQISEMLRARIRDGEFPSAVYAVAENDRVFFADAIGEAVREPEAIPATLGTIYDLASLTKPLVTGLLCAQLVESGELSLNRSISEYLPEFRRDKKQISVRDLLSHSSGLPAWLPLYLLTDNPAKVLVTIADQPLEYETGKRVVYSDLGFIVLGFMLERLLGSNIATLASNRIIKPLNLSRTFFNPRLSDRTGVAACESGNMYERDMCEKSFPAERIAKYQGWRQNIVWGEVHDGNANFLGDQAGHAGLFSTAFETSRLANQFIGPRSQLLSSATCVLFRQNFTPGLNEARSFAWQLAKTADSTAGGSLPPNAFGHTGFTGTSCWIDAEKARIFILLTNRTHHRPLPFANINATRREFHRLAVAALERG